MVSWNTQFVCYIVYAFAMITPPFLNIYHIIDSRGVVFSAIEHCSTPLPTTSRRLCCVEMSYTVTIKRNWWVTGRNRLKYELCEAPTNMINIQARFYISYVIFRACARCKNINMNISFKNQFTFNTYTFVFNFLHYTHFIYNKWP